MNCKRAKELLCLYAGGDLAGAEADRVGAHLQQCQECRKSYETLENNQKLLRSFRQETVSTTALVTMRQGLFSRLNKAEGQRGWWIRLERFFWLEMRRPRFAVAGVALAVIISATLFAQLRYVAANSGETIALESDTLALPAGYRDWVFVGSASQVPHSANGNGTAENVYMSPAAFREFKRTGKFPQGTMMILESTIQASLVASVKDERFTGGWGYFRFKDDGTGLSRRARALPETAGCAACHRDRAATDQVFTQFYPALKSSAQVL